MITNESIIVIPARSGSTGIINKNLKKVLNKELILRSFGHAMYMNSRYGFPVVITSDSDEYLSLVASKSNFKIQEFHQVGDFLELNGVYLHHRSLDLSNSESLITETLNHLANQFQQIGKSFANWCMLQPTSPFRSKESLDEISELLLDSKENLDFSLVSLTRVNDAHPARMYILNNGVANRLIGYENYYYDRRQDLPEIFIRDGAFYILGENLIKNKIQYSTNPNYIIREYPWNINIDSLSDLVVAQMIDCEEVQEDPNDERQL